MCWERPAHPRPIRDDRLLIEKRRDRDLFVADCLRLLVVRDLLGRIEFDLRGVEKRIDLGLL